MKQPLLLTLALVAAGSNLLAQDAAVGCTDSMLQGTYAVSLSGTAPAATVVPGSAALPGTLQQLIGLVLITFDGKGSFTQFDFVKGTLSGFSPARPGKGTYKVNADCTSISTISLPVAPFEIVSQSILTDGGRSYFLIVTSPLSNMTSGVGRRIQ